MTNDLRDLHARALRLADGFVARVGPADLNRPTPCGDWLLAELLAHMIGQHRGFATAVRTSDAPPEAYRPVPFDPGRWRDSVSDVIAAFAATDPDSFAVVVELTHAPLPVGQVVAAQLIDTVVHTWDIAESLGVPFSPPPDLLAATLAIAEALPDRAFGPGRAFANRLTADSDDPWQRTLALVGRRAGMSAAGSRRNS